MKKICTFLFFISCASMLWSQNMVSTYREYQRSSLSDTFRMLKENLMTYDKQKCLDTLIKTKEDNIYGAERSLILTKEQKKYNSQNRLTENLVRKEYYTATIQKPNVLTYKNTSILRFRYILTGATIKADTAITETYDSTIQKWIETEKFLNRKAGFGNDTVKLTNGVDIYDNKGRFIASWRKSGSVTTDSLRLIYDAKDRLTSRETFRLNEKNKLALSDYNGYVFTDDKLTKVTLGYMFNGDTTRASATITYLNGNVDYDIYENTQISKFAPTVITKLRNRYTKYNSFNRNTENERDEWQSSSSTWKLISRNKISYFKDTLPYRDSTFEISSGIVFAKTWDYENCAATVSSIQEANKGINFSISPNPTNGLVRLTLNEDLNLSPIQASVYTVEGKNVYQKPINTEGGILDLSHLVKGFYIIKLSNSQHFSSKKLIIN
jgi:Secretion system C-terminal sorting domain